MIVVDFLFGIATAVHIFWVFASVTMLLCDLLSGDRPKIATTVWQELRPFYLPAVSVELACEVVTGRFISWLDPFLAALAFASWWWFKDLDDPDDRWKRRKKKLSERVTLAGGRLRVVPVAR